MGLPAKQIRPVGPTNLRLAPRRVSVCLLGCGVVGGELLQQITDQAATLAAEHDTEVRLVALANSRLILVADAGLDPARAVDWLDGPLPDGVRRYENTPSARDALLRELAQRPVPVLVDATACEGHTALFQRAVQRGIHVATANKKPLVVVNDRVEALSRAARRHRRAVRFETTVGAGLPIIETIKNLRTTGDTVRRIEGSLSGTLGYLTHQVSVGVPLSVAVRQAVEQGYSEPQPQDDLSGADVGRKGLILARELGLRLELDDVEIEPLVPSDLLEIDDVEAFLAALESVDDRFARRVESAAARGRVLRYLAVVDPSAPTPVRVGPVEVDRDHPAARLRGTEAFGALQTRRYDPCPLVVQGPGAGGAVTAAGLLADLLQIARRG
jgi:aspartokinase/homoserine dehydrogenase 1